MCANFGLVAAAVFVLGLSMLAVAASPPAERFRDRAERFQRPFMAAYSAVMFAFAAAVLVCLL